MWNILASEERIAKTIKALTENGIVAEAVNTGEEAKKRLLEIIPAGVAVMNMSSTTLDQIGITKEIVEGNKYVAVKKKLMTMDREKDSRRMQEMGAAPEYAIGSVHAVTEAGQLVVASNSGSQIPAYAYGAEKVIWVVGTQKIVANLDDAMKRIYEYTLDLESERVRKANMMPKSNVSKMLIINKEVRPDRLFLIFVREVLGF
ncbi:hypothetical protein A3A84_02765 [Candidatus Collierbacteria bacterium RIFCSPLOWO2_01_FULL_50_23]|uniref:LUD domain-containing protein n=2 Tax=Candidatus Collieribacteriota TaxID=1752725 RepID=A0A1F5EV71_9BACT|nr:MAG: hypothetical protein A2703_01240 [Candidatus Collierbacteria bacterium RIFCSPHIGHO2_01_FULL_50_25]OGD71293.1 MAG: hypothetical protein A3D09_02690 [Candidatus Collierbacteria bacterium RIFCSPHIGHO2_02_FULL_49_10]OGD74988.1 MAG: hypothetical protein A3A84_02765 [Candidatus Collierbacteria bacterium RIFCSPLOWO2_01_FULL_50_23]